MQHRLVRLLCLALTASALTVSCTEARSEMNFVTSSDSDARARVQALLVAAQHKAQTDIDALLCADLRAQSKGLLQAGQALDVGAFQILHVEAAWHDAQPVFVVAAQTTNGHGTVTRNMTVSARLGCIEGIRKDTQFGAPPPDLDAITL